MSCKNKTVNADILPADIRYQIILPCISWVTTVVIMQCHEDGHPKTDEDGHPKYEPCTCECIN